LYNQPDSDIVSIKLFDLTITSSPVKIASKENENANFRPRLNLVFWDNSTEVLNINEQNKYSVFPNPVHDILNIYGTFDHAELMSSGGQLIQSTNSDFLNVKQIKNGIYLLRVFDKNKSVLYNLKVIKN